MKFFLRKLLIECEKIRQEFYSNVAGSLGKVKGIENALNSKLYFKLIFKNVYSLSKKQLKYSTIKP